MVMPFLRRLLLPISLVFCISILLSKTFQAPPPQKYTPLPRFQEQLRVPITRHFSNTSHHAAHLDPSDHEKTKTDGTDLTVSIAENPHRTKTLLAPALRQLSQCSRQQNRFTKHIRLPNLLYKISMTPRFATSNDSQQFWNPTIMGLPSWAKSQYLIVSMVVLDGGSYKKNILCEADICHPMPENPMQSYEKYCSKEDLAFLGPNGGLRCVTPPIEVIIPATAAEKCEGGEGYLADVAGFYDPRIFYSGRGEPLMMVVSQSRYSCMGLWTIDLRSVYTSLAESISSSPDPLGPGPLMSYPTLTELTRNPPTTRQSYEKNWLIFSPSSSTSYIQYEITSSRRTFAKLIGGGLTTENMTDASEEPCLYNATMEEIERDGFMATASWHQATPALKLILCTRGNTSCHAEAPDTVFFAAIQRKVMNKFDLPTRYERYFIVWSAKPPFNMLAVSQHPILMANETTNGWTEEQTWDDAPEALAEKRGFFGRFTYTTTIAYAWGREEKDIREKATGYLDDEVILSVGVDDNDQAYAIVVASELLQCLRVCPGRQ